MESDTKEVQPTTDNKTDEEKARERRDSNASSGNSSGTDVEANQGPISYTLSYLPYLSRSPHNNPCTQRDLAPFSGLATARISHITSRITIMHE